MMTMQKVWTSCLSSGNVGPPVAGGSPATVVLSSRDGLGAVPNLSRWRQARAEIEASAKQPQMVATLAAVTTAAFTTVPANAATDHAVAVAVADWV